MDSVFSAAAKHVRSGKAPAQSPERGVQWCRTAAKKLDKHDKQEQRKRQSPEKNKTQSLQQQQTPVSLSQQQQQRPGSPVQGGISRSGSSLPRSRGSVGSGGSITSSSTPSPSKLSFKQASGTLSASRGSILGGTASRGSVGGGTLTPEKFSVFSKLSKTETDFAANPGPAAFFNNNKYGGRASAGSAPSANGSKSAVPSSASSTTGGISPMLYAKLFNNNSRRQLPSLRGDDDDDEPAAERKWWNLEDEEEEEEEEEDPDEQQKQQSAEEDTANKKSVMSVKLKRDPNMRPGFARRLIGPELARLGLDLKEMAKEKMLDVQVDLRGWKIEEMLAAASASGDGTPTKGGGGGGVGFSSSAAGDGADSTVEDGSSTPTRRGKTRGDLYDGDSGGLDEGERRKLRDSFENAFSPLEIDPLKLIDGKEDKFRTYDQKLMYVRKRLLMEEAAKRRASVRYIREITGALRGDEKLLESFTEQVREQVLERSREHRAHQQVLDEQRKIFLERSPQQRASDFSRITQLRTDKVDHSRQEQEAAWLATCENAMAMRRGASFSRQYAWLPHLALVLRTMVWMKALRQAKATMREQRVMKAAQREFQDVFVPTRVTGFLRLAQGYKEQATKKTTLVGGAKAFSKKDLQLHQEIKKKKAHYAALRKAELDHPQYMMDRLLVKLRELQFPTLFMMWVRRRRHQSANILVSFLRAMFQQTVIRVRCKCYLKYVRHTIAAWNQALKNRHTRRHFMWVLQFRDLVDERKRYDLPTCVEADHVLKRRERMRQKCAMDQKRAQDAVMALRTKMVEEKVHEAARQRKEKEEAAEEDDDCWGSPASGPGSPTFCGSASPTSPLSRPGTSSQVGGSSFSMDGSTRPTTAGGGALESPVRGMSAHSTVAGGAGLNRPLQQGYLSPINSPTSTAAAHSPAATAAAGGSPTPLALQQMQQQQRNISSLPEIDRYRILAAPVMIQHPYGKKFGPQPREAANVARHMLDHFRCAEIKWAPTDSAMNAVLDWVLRAEDRAVLLQFQQWLAANKQHRERADFLKSVLGHLNEESATKADLEAQYEELLKSKPVLPRQPYILPPSEMRIFVYAAYMVTAHEKRVMQSQGSKEDDDNGGGGGGGGGGAKKKEQQQHPVFNEPNIKSHIAKAMGSFKDLHGSVRPFLLKDLGF